MTKFALIVAFAAVFGPVTAFAATTPVPVQVKAIVISTHPSNDLAFQVVHLNEQVLTLNNEVGFLEQQDVAGTGYVSELGGVIPSGG